VDLVQVDDVDTQSLRARTTVALDDGASGMIGRSFVARNTSSRRSAIARPTIRSDSLRP
jgi:hypothetical protein